MIRVIRVTIGMVLLACVVAMKLRAGQPVKEAEVAALEVTAPAAAPSALSVPSTPAAPVDYSAIAATLAGSYNALAGNTGSVKGSGRCIAFANDTGKYKLTLRVQVYAREDEGYLSRGWRLVSSGGKQEIVMREYQLDPGELISFNQKPRVETGSLIKGAAGTALLGLPGLMLGVGGTDLAAGDYQYLAGLSIAGLDLETGKSIFDDSDDGSGDKMRILTSASKTEPTDAVEDGDFVMLKPEELKKINDFIAKSLHDHQACKESEEQKTSALIVINRDNPPDALKAILDPDDPQQSEYLAELEKLSIVVPFKKEKGLMDRLMLHMTQHPNSFKAIQNVATAAIALARMAGGDASAAALLMTSLSGIGDSAFAAVKNKIGYGESATQIDQLSQLVKSSGSIIDAVGGIDKLLGAGGGALDAVGKATKSDYLKGAAGKLKENQGIVKSVLSFVGTGDSKELSSKLAQAAKQYFEQAKELDEQKVEEWELVDKNALQLIAAREGEAVLKLKELVDKENAEEKTSVAGGNAETGFGAVLKELMARQQGESGSAEDFELVESPEISSEYVKVESPAISDEYVFVGQDSGSSSSPKPLTFQQELEQAVQKRRQKAAPERVVGGEAASGSGASSASQLEEASEPDYVMVEAPSIDASDYQEVEPIVERDVDDDYTWIGRESESSEPVAEESGRGRSGVQLLPEQVQQEFEQRYVPAKDQPEIQVEEPESDTEDDDFVVIENESKIPSEGNQGQRGGFFQRIGSFFGLW